MSAVGNAVSGAFSGIAAIRARCWDNGFRPLSVYAWDFVEPPPPPGKKPGPKRAGKAPLGNGWQTAAREDPPACLGFNVVAWATNTGILADGLRAVDLDIDDPAIVAAVLRLAHDLLGSTIIRTRENSPRCLLVYRAAEGEPGKVAIEGAAHCKETSCRIEVLGRGQQFVAYGRHPSGAALLWRAGGPADVALADIPAITEAALHDFLKAVAAVIGARPIEVKRPKRERTGSVGEIVGDSFLERVNSAALADLGAWVPDLFPEASYWSSTGAYRVTSAALGRDLEEDLSFHPEGVHDFGLERGTTPIRAMLDFRSEFDHADAAALWLCEKLGLDPVLLGWTDPATQPTTRDNFASKTPDTLPNGAYLRPEDTTLPPLHPWITESLEEAEYRLRLSIESFYRSNLRVLTARREVMRRRADAIDGRAADLTPQEKAAITRQIMAEVAADYGFPGKLIPRPAVQLESGAQGNGKTTLVLECEAGIGDDLTTRKYAPTLAQAMEDAAKYRQTATEGSRPGFVVRGYGALDPLAEPGTRMCPRFQVVERAMTLGISPSQTICPGCKLATTCGRKRQDRTIEALGSRAIYFMSREYAHLPCPAPDADIVVGDEIMTLPAVTFASIEPKNMVGDLVPYRGKDLPDVMAARKTLERLRAPLMSAQPLAAVRDAGIGKERLKVLRRLLADEEDPHIHGAMPDALIDRKLDEIDHPDQRHMLAIVRAVLREIDMPRATFQAVRYNQRRDHIESARLRPLYGTKNAAVLLLDGTADGELNERLTRRKIAHNVVRMERDALVIGTIGKRYSRQSQTGKNAKGDDLSPDRVDAAKRLRDEIGTIASHFEAPLLTAPKQAAEALIDGGHLPDDVAVTWPELTRGRNEWETRMTAITVGGTAGSIEDMELIAGAFYATDPAPIVSMAARPEPSDVWPKWAWPYRATRLRRIEGGMLQVVHEDVHPDPRVQRVIEQITHAGITQDLDRTRPIYNHRTLVPLNERVLDLTYDRVLRHRELVEGGSRIDRVLKETDGVLPLTPDTLSALGAGSVSTARRALRAWRRWWLRAGQPPVFKWGHSPNERLIWDLTPYLARRPGQPGSASVVLVSDHHPDPKAAAEAVLGPLTAFWAAPMEEPQHPTEPPPAGPPADPDDVLRDCPHPFDPAIWAPTMPRQPGMGAAPPSVMVHGPPGD